MTETFLEIQENLQLIEFYLSVMLLPLLRRHEINLSSHIQLVIELVEPLDKVKHTPACGYYLVDHKNYCLFWPESFNANRAVSAVDCEITDSHFGTYIKSEYLEAPQILPRFKLEDVNILSHCLIGLVGD